MHSVFTITTEKSKCTLLLYKIIRLRLQKLTLKEDARLKDEEIPNLRHPLHGCSYDPVKTRVPLIQTEESLIIFLNKKPSPLTAAL